MGATYETHIIDSSKQLAISEIEFLENIDDLEKIGEGKESSVYRVKVKLDNGNETTLIFKRFYFEGAAEYHLVQRDRCFRADLPVTDIFTLILDKGLVMGILMEDLENSDTFLFTSNRSEFIHLIFKLLKEKNLELLEKIANMPTDVEGLGRNIYINASNAKLRLKSPDCISWMMPSGVPIMSDFLNVEYVKDATPVDLFDHNKEIVKSSIFLFKNAVKVANEVLAEGGAGV